MDFWQAIVIALLGGTVGGVVGILLSNFLSTKQTRAQKQQQLYGRLLGLQESLSDITAHGAIAQLNFEYYNRWAQLSDHPIATDEVKAWQQFTAECERTRSEKYAAFFETLGLIWVSFRQESELNGLIAKCFDIKPIAVEYPVEIQNIHTLKEWRQGRESQIRESVKAEVFGPINDLVNYLNETTFKKYKMNGGVISKKKD